MKNDKNIPSIQYLRGIAALMVVLFHSSREIRDQIGWNTLAWGEFGVDIFFCISGFIMLHSTSRHPKISAFHFFQQRVIRIAPLYWMMTCLMMGILLTYPSAFHSATADPNHFIASLLFVPQYHPYIKGSVLPILVPGWTLNYEMYFYLIFGATLAFSPLVQTLIVLGLIGCGAILSWAGFFGSSAFSEFAKNPIVFEFVWGMFIAILYKKKLLIPTAAARFVFISAMTLIMLTSHSASRLLTAGICSWALVYAALSLTWSPASVITKSAKVLGDSSYSLYLSHVFTIGLVNVLWNFCSGVPPVHTLALSFAYLSLCVLISVAVGIAMYKILEVPTTVFLRRRLQLSIYHFKEIGRNR